MAVGKAIALYLSLAACTGTGTTIIAQDAKKTDDKKPAVERFISLKGKAQDFEGLTLVGPDAEKCMRFEPEGVRITLPAGYSGERPATGVDVNMPIQGDFEITVNFELLLAPDPAQDFAGATRLNLLAYPKGGGFATVGWRVLVKRGRQTFANATGGGFKGAPTEMKKGRFRMLRQGTDVEFFVAEDASEKFVWLHKLPFGPADLKAIGLIGVTSDPKVMLDVRFFDLRVRTGASELAPPGTARLATRTGSGLAGWLLVGMTITVAALIVFWCFARRRTKPE